jgi:hypothetical protein
MLRRIIRTPAHEGAILTLVCLVSLAGLVAQSPAQSPVPSIDQTVLFQATLNQLFGTTTAFSAQAEMVAVDPTKTEILRAPMTFCLLEGKMRMELDLGQIKSSKIPPGAVESIQKMGMDRMVNVVRPDRKMTLLIYPSLASYVETPLANEDANAYTKSPKIEKTEMGKETVDAHPCVKSKIMMNEDNGRKHEGFIWMAKDMKDFPIQMQFNEPEASITMRFSHIQLARPDAALFNPPPEFKKYGDVQQLMDSVMQKMMQNPGANSAPSSAPPLKR